MGTFILSVCKQFLKFSMSRYWLDQVCWLQSNGWDICKTLILWITTLQWSFIRVTGWTVPYVSWHGMVECMVEEKASKSS